jgi:diguanylate cyclase (GGDEF)-like protein
MQVARILKGRVRRSEQVCRWGGEEFLLLLPDTNAFGGAVLAEALRSAVVATPFSCEQRSLDITMSFGIMADRGELPLEACINKADAALYAAKQQGRNRCVTHANATGDA